MGALQNTNLQRPFTVGYDRLGVGQCLFQFNFKGQNLFHAQIQIFKNLLLINGLANTYTLRSENCPPLPSILSRPDKGQGADTITDF